jgi:hypothetical protein
VSAGARLLGALDCSILNPVRRGNNELRRRGRFPTTQVGYGGAV